MSMIAQPLPLDPRFLGVKPPDGWPGITKENLPLGQSEEVIELLKYLLCLKCTSD
jgi:hypothetical protein